MGEAHATGLLQQDEPTSWSSSSAPTSDTPGPGAAVSDGRQGLSWQNDMEVYYFNGRDGTVRVNGEAFPRGRAGSASGSRGATSHASPTREGRRKEQATWRGWDAGDEDVSCRARVGGLLSSTSEGEVSDLQKYNAIKKLRIQQKRQFLQDLEDRELTFRPHMNQNSRRIFNKMRSERRKPKPCRGSAGKITNTKRDPGHEEGTDVCAQSFIHPSINDMAHIHQSGVSVSVSPGVPSFCHNSFLLTHTCPCQHHHRQRQRR